MARICVFGHPDDDKIEKLEKRLFEIDASLADEFEKMVIEAKRKAQRGPFIPPLERWPKSLRRFLVICLMPLIVLQLITLPVWGVPYWIFTGKPFDEAMDGLNDFIWQKVAPDYKEVYGY